MIKQKQKKTVTIPLFLLRAVVNVLSEDNFTAWQRDYKLNKISWRVIMLGFSASMKEGTASRADRAIRRHLERIKKQYGEVACNKILNEFSILIHCILLFGNLLQKAMETEDRSFLKTAGFVFYNFPGFDLKPLYAKYSIGKNGKPVKSPDYKCNIGEALSIVRTPIKGKTPNHQFRTQKLRPLVCLLAREIMCHISVAFMTHNGRLRLLKKDIEANEQEKVRLKTLYRIK